MCKRGISSPEARWRARENSRASAGIRYLKVGLGLMGISSKTLLFPRFTKSRIRTKAIGTIRCNYNTIRMLTFIDSMVVNPAEIRSSRLYGDHKKLFPALPLLPSVLSIIAFSGWLLAWSPSIFPGSEPYIGTASWVLPRVASDEKPSDSALLIYDGVPLQQNISRSSLHVAR